MNPEATARTLLKEEIGRIVADVKERSAVLVTGRHAASLFAAYPGANFSIGRIVDELALEATRQGVAVELSRPD